jgi:glycosyltransferase involved in cell wall biosynthesis
VRRVLLAAGLPRRWARLLRSRPAPGAPRVYYGHDRIPEPHETRQGGLAKLHRLAREFPNTPSGFNVLYLGSNTLPPDRRALLALARRRRIPLVWNQDGVAYPAWHGPGWERVNAPMAAGLRAAAHVLYQSAFCKLAADRYLGEPRGPWEVLHNAVDTAVYTPGTPPERPTLLVAGTHHQRYRLEVALRALVLLPEEVRLLVAGEPAWGPGARRETEALVAQLGLGHRVELLGAYREHEAPALYRRAGVLLHPKVMDPCPNVVVEALACGLPVVFSDNGGTPELVGDAGAGVPAALDWERDRPPSPEAFAAAAARVLERRDELALRARARAVERFDVRPWLARHRALFEELAG